MNERDISNFFLCIGVEPTSAAFNKSVVEKSGAVQAVVKVFYIIFIMITL